MAGERTQIMEALGVSYERLAPLAEALGQLPALDMALESLMASFAESFADDEEIGGSSAREGANEPPPASEAADTPTAPSPSETLVEDDEEVNAEENSPET